MRGDSTTHTLGAGSQLSGNNPPFFIRRVNCTLNPFVPEMLFAYKVGNSEEPAIASYFIKFSRKDTYDF
jgi:hypothetical protein